MYEGFQLQYKMSEVYNVVRKEQFDALDFLSFVGGILGLFAGFSALSFIELIYWFTFRIFIENKSSRVNPNIKIQKNLAKFEIFCEFFKSYFKTSSIHGLKYIFKVSKITR